MNSHELAKILLEYPDLPIATHANNHTYLSYVDRKKLCNRGECYFGIGILETYKGKHIIIGNMTKKNINTPNEYISSMITSDIPLEWR